MTRTFAVGDTIEMSVDMPDEGLRRGDRGTVLRVVNVPNGIYELEFRIYADFPPLQLMLSTDEINQVVNQVPFRLTRPYDSKSVLFHLQKWEADNLIDVLRYVQTDPTVHQQQRLWCFNLGNEIEQLVRRPSTEAINDALHEAASGEQRVSIIRRQPPKTMFSRSGHDWRDAPF